MSSKLLYKNKKAFFNYEILERIETGIVLTGSEVKSVKGGQVSMQDAFVRIINGEAWLWNCDIPLYKHSDIKGYDPLRTRKLLIHRKEIDSLEGKAKQARLTLVPVAILLKAGKIKIEVGLARGKKQYEKKLRMKERDLDRELHREKRKYMVK